MMRERFVIVLSAGLASIWVISAASGDEPDLGRQSVQSAARSTTPALRVAPTSQPTQADRRSPKIPTPTSANRTWSLATVNAHTQQVTQVSSSKAFVRDARNQGATVTTIQVPQPGIAPIPQPTLDSFDMGIGRQSMSLQAALYGAITSNPDLVTLRQGNAIAVSAEAVEVARNFPTTLNPTLWIDYRPITLIPNGTFGSGAPGGHEGLPGANGFYHYGQNYIYVSLRQPVELGHQTTHRYRIARAAYEQQKWVIVQAELTALVQAYRFFQTAAYRREKFRLAKELAEFNDRLLESLERRMEANPTLAADASLARVETRASRQQIKAAQQDYLVALADLRNQIGAPEQAGAIEPLGEFNLPTVIPTIDEEAMIQEAIKSRPDIHAASAQVAGTHSAVNLARADRIPTPIIGPQYAMDEAAVQYIGFVLIAPIPIWNNGKPLVMQREAEHRRAVIAFQQAQQRAMAQVRAAVAKWNSATQLVNASTNLSSELSNEINLLDRLFEAGQTDLTKLMQARQRMIQLENSRLDAVWQATQAQADLLLALGIPSLINGMLSRAESDATTSSNKPSPINALTPQLASSTIMSTSRNRPRRAVQVNR